VSITQLHSLEMEIALRLLSVNSEEGNRTDVLSNRPVPKRKPLFRRKDIVGAIMKPMALFLYFQRYVISIQMYTV